MIKDGRDQHIKSIIRLEERISNCRRCVPSVNCTRKPSLGKGDLEPDVLLVFECESAYTLNTNWIIELRNAIKKHLQIERVYHTFMVRCQPKACTLCQANNYFPSKKLLDRENICLLSRQACDGIPIKPINEEILNCLTFLLEEIAVFKPNDIILFGPRVSNFVLKSYGKYDSLFSAQPYQQEKTTFHTTAEEKYFFREGMQKNSGLVGKI